ncbi:uncharacterized protein LOC135951129 isoform X2 [Calliphora vicina]|uniref:uncharacterized protein LOC135951129 isoform X2 n=1 Tax=Calliphora vicina TaxID=7373 RepID=UPI00325AF58B
MLKLDSSENSSPKECQDLCLQLDKLALKSDSNDDENASNFTSLPLEILYNIFESCPLREQLVLAKLQDYEISEFCYLCGRAVERARFSTYFNMDLLKHIEWSGIRTNPMENLKYFINDNFKQNVKYFKNLQELEVQGKFLQDQTIKELSINCKKLKTLRLLDGDNRWLWGEHLQDLQSIENLELKSCRNLDPNHLIAVSEKRHLKSLNIVECEHLKDIPQMLKLCNYWLNLETLRLTAFSQDNKFIKAILNLPKLKILQFYWINFMPLNFEETFFLELSLHKTKSLQLKNLKFENDRYYIEDESLQQWSDEQYAIMRENVCINGQSWQWSSEIFDKISLNFENFKNLLTLSFHYCRLLDYEQMKCLSLINDKLELIKVLGCPKKEDVLFKKQWLQEQVSAKCHLSFESLLPLAEVLNLYEEANSRQFSSFYRREPVLRSIECQFN